MADRRRYRQLAALGIEVTVELQGRDRDEVVVVLTPSGDEVLVDPREHREDVVRRLLGMGVTPGCLRALLPDWSPLITRVADDLALDDGTRVIPEGDAQG